MSDAKIEVYFFRHGESEYNAKYSHLIGGRQNDSPLTEKGEMQARRLGEYLLEQGLVPDKVYVSPAVRTLETARITLTTMGLDVQPLIHDALQEMDQGEWTGLVRDEIHTDEIKARREAEKKAFKAPGGESMDDVGLRKMGWVTETFGTGPVSAPERHFVFGHGVAIRSLFSLLHNWDYMETYQTQTPNTSISLLVGREGEWSMEYVGQTPHLDKDELTI